MESGGGEGLDAALHGAVKFGHLDMAKWLLDKGADANVKNFDGKTPLRVAIKSEYEEIAELLRRSGGVE